MSSAQNKTFNNALNSLSYNEQLSKIISETICNIDRNIESLQDSQEYLICQVKKEDQIRGSYVMQFLNAQNINLIRTPYFITPIGLTPPTNKIQKLKYSSGTYDFYELKRELTRICSHRELTLLKEEIGKNVLDIEMKRYTNSSEKTKTREINTLMNKPFEILAEKCDSFMIDKIDWLGISTLSFKGKISPENCRKIWEQTFNPEFVVPKWTDIECKELLSLVDEFGPHGNWVKIASKMSMKIQPYRCFKKWLDLTSKMETSDEWSADEDKHLCEIVMEIKGKQEKRIINWNKVSVRVSNRSARDCERRYISLQSAVNTRPFTDEEDYQLLLLIKKMTMENWGDISREMNQRTIEQCQERYCEIVEESYPWTYHEDRKLWIYLKPHFQDLWCGNDKVEDVSRDLQLYKSVINCFNGRFPLLIRHRYLKLCKWFLLWNRFYLGLNNETSNNDSDYQTMSLLCDKTADSKILAKIKNIILNTYYFDALRKVLRSHGSKNPDGDANELVLLCKSGNLSLLRTLLQETTDQNLLDFLMFFWDLQNGIFIPRQFEKYIHRPNNVLKNPRKADLDLRCLSTNFRKFEIKTAIINSLKKRLTDLTGNISITEHDKVCIETLLNCEGKFTAALNFAIYSLERTCGFDLLNKTDVLEKMLPQFLKVMIQYVYDSENNELLRQSLVVRYNSQTSTKRQQIAELLLYGKIIPSIYKVYPKFKRSACFLSQNLPSSAFQNLLKCEKSAAKISKALSAQQHTPFLDKEAFGSCDQSSFDSVKAIRLMTPNKCTLHLLRAFFLQKHDLLNTCKDELARIVRLKYDHPINYLASDKNVLKENPLEIDKCDLSSWKYLLLKARIISLLAIPSVIARLSPFTTALVADKLHEAQNGCKNSTEISGSFNSISKLPDSIYRVAGSRLFHGQQAPSKSSLGKKVSKRKMLDYIEDDLSETEMNYIPPFKVSQNQKITRRTTHNWISIFLPDCQRTVFVSKNILNPFITANFTIESINGVNVNDFLK